VYKAESDQALFALFSQKAALLERAAELRAELANTLLANFKTECRARVQVMQRLGFLGEDGQVTLKGRAACEIDATDELLATGGAGCVVGWVRG
jgi:ATP-dependent RNA helicase DOB1